MLFTLVPVTVAVYLHTYYKCVSALPSLCSVVNALMFDIKSCFLLFVIKPTAKLTHAITKHDAIINLAFIRKVVICEPPQEVVLLNIHYL